MTLFGFPCAVKGDVSAVGLIKLPDLVGYFAAYQIVLAYKIREVFLDEGLGIRVFCRESRAILCRSLAVLCGKGGFAVDIICVVKLIKIRSDFVCAVLA